MDHSCDHSCGHSCDHTPDSPLNDLLTKAVAHTPVVFADVCYIPPKSVVMFVRACTTYPGKH